MRIRQLVIAGRSAETADLLGRALGLGEPFKDPGVAEFGLDNAVFAIGDQFLEVVWPIAPTAPVNRFLERHGEGGYMAIFETSDIDRVRRNARDSGVRPVWSVDLDDIRATHFHPADIGGAIVSVDQPEPAGEWRWGGPDWRKRSVEGRLVAARLVSPEPRALSDQWGRVLGYGTEETETGAKITLEGGELVFDEAVREILTAFAVTTPFRKEILARAQALGLETHGRFIRIGGVDFDIRVD